jgi:hypothetical protein
MSPLPVGWLLADGLQPTLGLSIHIRRERPSLGHPQVLGEVIGIHCPHNGGVGIGVREGEAQEKRTAALPWREQLVQLGLLPESPALALLHSSVLQEERFGSQAF